jgi:hypothetical protein
MWVGAPGEASLVFDPRTDKHIRNSTEVVFLRQPKDYGFVWTVDLKLSN